MKIYIIKQDFEMTFYPALTKVELYSMYEKYLFEPLRNKAKEIGNELIIKEELPLIGKAVIEASDKVAKALRARGYHLQTKKIIRSIYE
jgi:hypothetical protein